MTTLMQASRQWASRPSDERFTSLTALHDKVRRERANSIQSVISTRKIEVQPHPADQRHGITIAGDHGLSDPTNWSFNQLAALAGAPASYLRKLPAPIVADAMNYGLRFNRDAEDVGILRSSVDRSTADGHLVPMSELRAATGPRYGRVWNDEIVGALVHKFGDGVTGPFKVPGEFGKDVRVDDVAITKDTLKTAQDDYAACM